MAPHTPLHRKIRQGTVIVGLSLLLIAFNIVLAQSTAQVSGTVRDQTGAVLPGVAVALIQTSAGLNRSAVTDETGSYILPNSGRTLPLGSVAARLPDVCAERDRVAGG
jgi:Carboxypeptidase regulatory-like domain